MTLKGTWDQSNNFCLKGAFFIIKQNSITKKIKKFTCKPQLAYFACSYVIKLAKNAKKTRSGMFYTFAVMTSLTLNSKVCNFLTS